MIKAILVFEEKELNQVDIKMTIPPADTSETDNESKMALTYLAFGNCISDPKYFEKLGDMLIPEINRILKEMEKEDASQSLS